MVGKLQRGRARAAFGAVHHDEIGRDAGFQHRLDDAHEFAPMADAELEPHRLAPRQFAQLADKGAKFERRGKGRMRRGGDTVLSHRDAARLGDFGGDLGCGQHAAMAGLGPLAELDFDHLDLRIAGLCAEFLGVKAPIGGAAAEIARRHLIDQVAAPLPVIARDAAFAGVMGKTARLGSAIERKDRIGRHRPERHGRDVIERCVIGLLAILAADFHAEIAVGQVLGRDGMRDPAIAGIIHTLARAKGAFVFDVLGALIDDGPHIARERLFVHVAFDQILADLGADAFKDKAHMPHHRIVAQDRMIALGHIIDPHQRQHAKHQHPQPSPAGQHKQRP